MGFNPWGCNTYPDREGEDMSDKSYVTMEQHVCLVCGTTYDTGSILLDRRLRKTFDHKTVTGNGLCPEHQKLYDEGYIALIEIDPMRSAASASGYVKPEDAYRTGVITHMRRAAFSQVFNTSCERDGKMLPLIFVDAEVTAKLKSMMKEAA